MWKFALSGLALVPSLGVAADPCPIREVVGLYQVTAVHCEQDGKPCTNPEQPKWVKVWMDSATSGYIGISDTDPFGGYYAFGFDARQGSSAIGSYYSMICQESVDGGTVTRKFYQNLCASPGTECSTAFYQEGDHYYVRRRNSYNGYHPTSGFSQFELRKVQ